jgi:hypothetical protein
MAERAHSRTSPGDGGGSRRVLGASPNVLAFATLLGERLNDERDQLALAAIVTSAERVATMVEAVRVLEEELAAPGGADRPTEPVDVEDVLHRVLAANRPGFTLRGIAVTTDPSPGIFAMIDPAVLEVMVALLSCWALLRALPGAQVRASVRIDAGAAAVAFDLGAPAYEDGSLRIARRLAVSSGSVLRVDEARGVAELIVAPGRASSVAR